MLYNIVVGKPEGKRTLGRPRHRWEDIKMNLRKIEWEGVDWMHMAQDRPVEGSCDHSNKPLGSIKDDGFD
jgi:hypothetical protein